METLKEIFGLARPYWRRALIGLIFGVVVSGVTGAIAWLTKPALDTIFIEKRYEYLALLPIAVFVLFSLKGLLQFGQAYFMRTAGMQLLRDTQNRLHNHILQIPVGHFHQESSGMMISRFINDVRLLGSIFPEVIKTAIVSVPTIVVLMSIALYRKWDLTLLSITILPLAAYSTRKFGKRVKKRTLSAQNKLASLTQKLSESIIGAKVIKIFNSEQFRDTQFIEENRRVYRENVKVIKLKELTKVMIDITTGVAIGLILWYGGNQVKSGVITSGDFASIIAAIYLIFTPAKQLGESYTALQEIKAALERVNAVLHISREESGGKKIARIKNEIIFDRVSFSYRSEYDPVLTDVNLKIRAGEIVAIVGPSGAGKSTIADLIPRFYDPTSGRIAIDGNDIREFDLSALRSLIGIVSQDVILFNDTIRQNILFGRKDATEDEIREAARLAFADEFIRELPEGYDTVIGERGLKLSGGQRQRIAIARAILKNPPILILDEATSALDTVSESIVQKALEGLMQHRTTIVIAHRLSTVKNADKIVVLDRGSIRETGTHDELLATSETYAKLYREMSLN